MYSQNSEEEIILNYFGNKEVCFLDIGANDGKTLSNTYALGLLPNFGTLVEASPKAFKKLQENYKGASRYQLLNYAVGTYDGKIILHESGEHLGNGDIGLLSTIKYSEVKRWTKEEFTGTEVECITFETLLEKSNYKTFDFISMDIEGMELDILPQMDLNALDCKLICVEFNGKEKEKYDAIIVPQGFHLIHTNSENLIYARN